MTTKAMKKAHTELTADQVRELYQQTISDLEVRNAALEQSLAITKEGWGKAEASLKELSNKRTATKTSPDEKLTKKIEQKDLYISTLQAQINQLQAQNASLVGDDLESKALAEIRERIKLLQEELKARESQALFQIFGHETSDQLDTLTRRYDYFDESYKRIQTQTNRIADLEKQLADPLTTVERRDFQMRISSMKLEAQAATNLLEEQATKIEQLQTYVEELLQGNHDLSTENSDLRSERAELAEQKELLQEKMTGLEAKLEVHLELQENRIVGMSESQIAESLAIAHKQLQDLQTEKARQKSLLQNNFIEAQTKVVGAALWEVAAEKQKDADGWVHLGSEKDFGKKIGASRTTVGSHLNLLKNSGVIDIQYGEEVIELNKKGGTRKVTTHPISFKFQPEIGNHPEHWRKPSDIKKQGGFGKRKCGNCGFEDLENIPHTRCRCCGEETVKYPLTSEEKLLNEAAIATQNYQQIIESKWIVTKPGEQQHGSTGPISLEVQDEHQEISEPASIEVQEPERSSDELTPDVQSAPAPEADTRDRRILRIEAWGAANGYPRARLSNGAHIPDGPLAWKGFLKYREESWQIAYDDICEHRITKEVLA